MINVIYFLSSKSQYDKMIPVLNKISSKIGYKVFVISFERWTDTSFLRDKEEFEFEHIVIPRLNTSTTHYRNIRLIESEYVSNLDQIQKILKSIPTNKSILVKEHVRNSNSFGIEVIAESFLPQIQAVFYIQKHLYSDSVFWSLYNSYARSISKFVLAFHSDYKNLINYRLLARVIIKSLKIRFLSSNQEIFCCFNQFEYNNLIKNKNSRFVYLVKNLYVEELKKFKQTYGSSRNVVFITSGAFKYKSKIKHKIELDLIRQLNRVSRQYGLNFLVKLKDGESSRFFQHKSYAGLIDSQIIDGEPFNLYARSFNDIIITPIDSSVFLESIILKISTFYYLQTDNKFLDLYSFLRLDSMNLQLFEIELARQIDDAKIHELELMKDLILKEVTSSVNLDLADLILSIQI